jgi:hypothetical protein
MSFKAISARRYSSMGAGSRSAAAPSVQQAATIHLTGVMGRA